MGGGAAMRRGMGSNARRGEARATEGEREWTK